MPPPSVRVYVCPAQLCPDDLPGTVAVVIDVLRATTTMTHALAAGCRAIYPCAEIDEARNVARSLAPGRILLAGERDGVPVPGFDLGNSPGDFTLEKCKGAIVVMTTSNGTRALLHAAAAEIVLLACFNNLSAVCELLRHQDRPVHILCAGDGGEEALEDTLVAGAIVNRLGLPTDDPAAQRAEVTFDRHREHLATTLEVCKGGLRLRLLGYDEDIRLAARIDTLAVVSWLLHEPARVVAAPDRL